MSLEAVDATTRYSSSIEERAMVRYFLKLQEVELLPKNTA